MCKFGFLLDPIGCRISILPGRSKISFLVDLTMCNSRYIWALIVYVIILE
jgi:hypothetical protein